MPLCTVVLTYLILHSGGSIERKVLFTDEVGTRIEERELERDRLRGVMIRNLKTTRYDTPFDCAKGPGER